MTGDRAAAVAAVVVSGTVFLVAMTTLVRHGARKLPANILRRIGQTGQSVSFVVRGTDLPAWDPSGSSIGGGFWVRGTVTYTRESPTRIHVHFEAQDGRVIDRIGTIPDSLLPDPPEARRRKRLAREIIALYVGVGVLTFGATARFIAGSNSLRLRVAALVASSTVAIAWLAMHLLLRRRHRQAPRGRAGIPFARPDTASRRGRLLTCW